MQTAKEFGKPIALEGLDAWARGALEGQPVKKVEGQVKFLMLHPDKKPPGVSPISKEPGESLEDFSRSLLGTIQAILAMMGSDQRVLVCSHGGNLQCINQWLKDRRKEDLSFDHKDMAKTPYWSVVGRMWTVGKNGLEEVTDNEKPNLYLCEHSFTNFNSANGNDKSSKR